MCAFRAQICFCDWLALMAFSPKRRNGYGKYLAICVAVRLIPLSAFQWAADDSPSPAPVGEGMIKFSSVGGEPEDNRMAIDLSRLEDDAG